MSEVLHLAIDMNALLGGQAHSESVKVAEIDWNIRFTIERNSENIPVLVSRVKCREKCRAPTWAVQSSISTAIQSIFDVDVENVYTNHDHQFFDIANRSWNKELISVHDLLNHGIFVDDGRVITVKVMITIINKQGIFGTIFNLNKRSRVTNTHLIVQTRSVYVNRELVTMASRQLDQILRMDPEPVQINAPFSEENLIVFFSSCHSKKNLNDDNVKAVLEIAQFYEHIYVLGICEKHLIKYSRWDWEDKFVIADRYRLSRLFELCLQEMNLHNFHHIILSERFVQFDVRSKDSLLRKAVELTQP